MSNLKYMHPSIHFCHHRKNNFNSINGWISKWYVCFLQLKLPDGKINSPPSIVPIFKILKCLQISTQAHFTELENKSTKPKN